MQQLEFKKCNLQQHAITASFQVQSSQTVTDVLLYNLIVVYNNAENYKTYNGMLI